MIIKHRATPCCVWGPNYKQRGLVARGILSERDQSSFSLHVLITWATLCSNSYIKRSALIHAHLLRERGVVWRWILAAEKLLEPEGDKNIAMGRWKRLTCWKERKVSRKYRGTKYTIRICYWPHDKLLIAQACWTSLAHKKGTLLMNTSVCRYLLVQSFRAV